jgi:hypothetical protein
MRQSLILCRILALLPGWHSELICEKEDGIGPWYFRENEHIAKNTSFFGKVIAEYSLFLADSSETGDRFC